MTEKILIIEKTDPAIFFSSDSPYLRLLIKTFPTLKISARGNEIKASGPETELELFERKTEILENLINNRSTLNEEELMAILNGDQKSSEIADESELKSNNVNNDNVLVFGPNGKIVRARTPNQIRLVNEVDRNDIVFAVGPAGTGKTYTAVALAVRALKNKTIKRIFLARPAVEAGENLGFLPGDLKEKIDPYLRPLYDSLQDMLPEEKYQKYIENRTIEIAPMAFMRGRTLDNCFVILDEAQNSTNIQLRMFLTRMGPNAKVIITGDLTQVDLPPKMESGLRKAIKILDGIKGISTVYLDVEDVVRHPLVKKIIKAYGKEDGER
ncbi:MAG: PhoH family protein [Flavobacteriales bacterium]|nr:PhoH family protein [Flavobacteriales bacterium]